MSLVRFAIVGYGNIGKAHLKTLQSDAVSGAEVTAIVTQSADALPKGVQKMDSLDELLSAQTVDVVVIATPTMTHTSLGRKVLAARHHLVMEKPVAMTVGEARDLAQDVPEGIHAVVMLNQRFHPAYSAIKSIVDSGILGRIRRFNWLMTAWYRPDVYFDVSRWRGTWAGEGGGALLNQCIHNLDVLQWLLGLPTSVVADVQFGKYHTIEVEDEVSGLLTYPDGMSGVVVASTGEAPGMNQVDIWGDKGALHYDGKGLTLDSMAQSTADHCATTNDMFGMPEYTTKTLTLGDETNQHAQVFQNVVNAVLHDAELTTPLVEGLGALELANAMLLSAWRDQRVSLPLDVDDYQARLSEKIRNSTLREPKVIDVKIDMDASYR